MIKVLILGAGGQIARHVIDMLAGDGDLHLTLFARNTARLAGLAGPNQNVVQGDVLDAARLDEAMQGQDIVYANLTGADLDRQARAVIAAMKKAGIRRLIFILALGIYDEVSGKFGEWNAAMIGEDLKPFRRAGDAIEASGLEYTILRPAWLMDEAVIDYETTARNEPFKGTSVSRVSVADLVARIVRAPDRHVGENLGVDKPGTDGDKPDFM
ncbi:SDR family oxidoreductase [Mesorhizobium sp. B2-4-6]|uniref:SDR family oxidoreductase n=1 Tax=Mesorhizobium sp. B2-4-6 TaxID=2589943 RepID=UPI00112A6B71|nr:SDR family oxidoreductase [Mesorhizobium sp. B2-4-6]TPL43063.1 SDR family oxidoreductase [Mesorhizobium sp. B2-4-6]